MDDELFGSIDEARSRIQMESDREFGLRAQSIGLQAKRIAIEKGVAAANAWYQRQMVSLARDKFEEDKRQFDATFGENQRQFNAGALGYMVDPSSGQRVPTFPRERWTAETSGYFDDQGTRRPTFQREQWQDNSLRDWSQLAASLKGPEDWVQYHRLTKGLANNLASMPGLNWLSGGQAGSTTNAGQAQPLVLHSLLRDMGAVPSSWASAAAGQAGQQAQQQQASGGTGASGTAFTPSQQQILQTANEFAAAPQMAAPGWLEGLDPTMVAMLKGAAESQGHSWADVMQRYNRARWTGPGSAQAA